MHGTPSFLSGTRRNESDIAVLREYETAAAATEEDDEDDDDEAAADAIGADESGTEKLIDALSASDIARGIMRVVL